jgi:hypothetical protein
MEKEFNVNVTKNKTKTNHGLNTDWTIVSSMIP